VKKHVDVVEKHPYSIQAGVVSVPTRVIKDEPLKYKVTHDSSVKCPNVSILGRGKNVHENVKTGKEKIIKGNRARRT